MPIDDRSESKTVKPRLDKQTDRKEVNMRSNGGTAFVLGILLLVSASQAEDEFQLWVNPADVALNLSEHFKGTVQARSSAERRGSLHR